MKVAMLGAYPVLDVDYCGVEQVLVDALLLKIVDADPLVGVGHRHALQEVELVVGGDEGRHCLRVVLAAELDQHLAGGRAAGVRPIGDAAAARHRPVVGRVRPLVDRAVVGRQRVVGGV